MARKILFKTGTKVGKVPSGFKSLSLNDDEQINLTGSDLKSKRYLEDANPYTMISDSDYYSFEGEIIYPKDYWSTFNHEGSTFHLVDMRSRLDNHDWYDTNYEANFYFGIFKENGSKLEFIGAFDPTSLIDINDFFDSKNGKFKGVTGFDIPNSPSYNNQTVTFLQTSTTGLGTGFEIEVTFNGSGDVDTYTIIDEGTGYKMGEQITTNDPYAGSIVITVSGINFTNYPFYIFDNYFFRKVSTGLEFVAVGMDSDNYHSNVYYKYNLELNSDGTIKNLSLINSRSWKDVNASSIRDLMPGYELGDYAPCNNANQYSFYINPLIYFTRTKDDKIDWGYLDVISNSITILIEDIETWWGENADIDWEIDVNGIQTVVNFKGGLYTHPTSPLLLGTHNKYPKDSSSNFAESYLVSPTKYHRFSDNKTVDLRVWLGTENKIWLMTMVTG